jgi:hypothetical protein
LRTQNPVPAILSEIAESGCVLTGEKSPFHSLTISQRVNRLWLLKNSFVVLNSQKLGIENVYPIREDRS